LSTQGIWDEVSLNEQAIFNVIGKRPRHFRAPYGSTNIEVLNALGSWGYTVTKWNMDTEDYNNNGDWNLNKVGYNSALSQNAQSYILLNHDFSIGILDWLDFVIPDMRDRGFNFVTMDQCIGFSAYF
jgi:peptidoglycan/xylan/chitin deacetylase (PgdA/CDA1 family)